jgi:hypothetical protein
MGRLDFSAVAHHLGRRSPGKDGNTHAHKLLIEADGQSGVPTPRGNGCCAGSTFALATRIRAQEGNHGLPYRRECFDVRRKMAVKANNTPRSPASSPADASH